MPDGPGNSTTGSLQASRCAAQVVWPDYERGNIRTIKRTCFVVSLRFSPCLGNLKVPSCTWRSSPSRAPMYMPRRPSDIFHTLAHAPQPSECAVNVPPVNHWVTLPPFPGITSPVSVVVYQRARFSTCPNQSTCGRLWSLRERSPPSAVSHLRTAAVIRLPSALQMLHLGFMISRF